MRKLFFWTHLAAGCLAGLVILIMSATGVLLMYEKQIVAWADDWGRRVEPGAARLPVESLIAKYREARGGLPSQLTLRSDPSAPAVLLAGERGVVLANPYTGELLGEGAVRTRAFFRAVTDWHRWLGMNGPARAAGRAVTGASNLAFLLLVTSGFYLWWPRKWTAAHLKSVALFRGGLVGRARDFNWHNVAGLWCAVPLFFIVLSGVVISYPWASALIYRPAGPGGGRAAGPPRPPAASADLAGLNALWDRAERQMPRWRSITLRLPPSSKAPVSFIIDQGWAGQPQKRGTLTLARATGEVVRWETFEGYEPGRRARTWLRFVHTGEYYGLAGQTVAGIASAGAVLLVWTGVSLALRRLRSYLSRRRRAVEEVAALHG